MSYSSLMQKAGFEEALTSRVDDMLDACTKCGKCFEVCPIAEPADLGECLVVTAFPAIHTCHSTCYSTISCPMVHG